MVASGRDGVSHAGLFEISTTERAAMTDWECPHCDHGYKASGSHEDDSGEHTCDECGCRFVVRIDYEPSYWVETISVVSPEEQKRNDAMERGDYLRDRAKDERGQQ